MQFRAMRKFFSFWRRRLRRKLATPSPLLCLLILLILLLCYFLGIDLMVREQPYYNFSYPFNTPDPRLRQIVQYVRAHPNSSYARFPIYSRYSKLHFRSFPVKKQGCGGKKLLIFVRSAPENFEHRSAIRDTWGKEADGGVLFFVGNPEFNSDEILSRLKEERQKYADVVVLELTDSDYNSTAKTVMEIRFAAEMCKGSWKHALLIHDDYYLSVKGLEAYLAEEKDEKERLFGGFVFPASKPSRQRFLNPWYISLADYSFSHFPPYVAVGAVLFSKEALLDFHTVTSFVAPFPFDGIYLGICAKKLGINPRRIAGFEFWKRDVENKKTIAANGFPPDRLRSVWQELIDRAAEEDEIYGEGWLPRIKAK